MPRAIDLTPQNLQVDHNPTVQLGMSADQVGNFMSSIPELIEQALEAAINQWLTEIDNATGLNLLHWATLIENLLTGAGHSTSGDLLTNFTDWLTTIGSDAVTALQNWVSFLETVDQDTVLTLASWLDDIESDASNAWNNIQGMLGHEWTDLKSAWRDLMGGIFGSNLGAGILGGIPSSAVVKASQSLQPVWDFPNDLSINAASGWVFDGTQDHTGTTGSGSVQYTCNGTLGVLQGVIGPVQPSQIVAPSAWLMWTGVTASSGTSPFQLQLVPYSGSLAALTAGTPITVAEITSPSSSSSWTELTGTYTAPSDGSVTAIQMQLVVTADATTGTVNWDDCTSDVTQGGFIDDWIYSLYGHRDAPTTASQVLSGAIGNITLGSVTDSIENHLRALTNGLAQALGAGSGDFSPGQVFQIVQTIPAGTLPVTNAAASSTVAVVGSGAGVSNGAGNYSGHGTITWTDTIPSTANYVVVVVHCASTNGSGSTCSITSPSTVGLSLLASQSYGSGSPVVSVYGLANPPTGSVTFSAQSNEAASVVTLIAGTSISFSGVGSVQDIAYEDSGTNVNPSLATSYISPAVVVNAIGAFGRSGTNVALTGYTGGTQAFHAGANSATTFMTDLFVGTVTSPSSPTFSATAATVSNTESFGAIAIALNPISTATVIGHGFRQHRSLTANVSATNGYNPFPNTFFDHLDFAEYSTVDSTTNGCRIAYTGHYSVTLHVLESNTGVSHLARAILYQNGSIVRNGPTLVVTQNASDTFIVGASWNVYCVANDLLQPGYWVSRAVSNIFTGESTGAKTFWEVSLVNRSLM